MTRDRSIHPTAGIPDRLQFAYAKGSGPAGRPGNHSGGGVSMSFGIWGIGIALPAESISQERAAEVINLASGYDEDQSRWVESLYQGAGVRRRHLLMLEHLDEILGSPGGVPRFTTSWRMGRYEE